MLGSAVSIVASQELHDAGIYIAMDVLAPGIRP